MIPKIIHLCWFGRGEYPELVKLCLESWKKYLPDYEIRLWNEDSFDVNSIRWTKEAYEAKKWAFVSDFVRLKVLTEEGGLYMDTDLELIQTPDYLLKNKSFVASFIEGGLISAGFLAAEPHHPFVEKLLSYYQDRPFLLPNGNMDTVMNPLIFSETAIAHFCLSASDDAFSSPQMEIYPMEILMPFHKNILNKAHPYSHRNYRLSPRTVAIHHDMGSWAKRSPLRTFFLGTLRLLLPDAVYLACKKRKNCKLLSQKAPFSRSHI